MSDLRRRVARSPFARLAAFPLRLRLVGAYDVAVLRRSARWLVRSREHTNFTYRLTPRNLEHLAWWVAELAGRPVGEIRGYLAELDGDDELRRHLLRATATSERRGLADREVRYARRAGWYALVRALRPAVVVETGTDKGLGSCVLAAALLANGAGRLVTIDVNDDSGYLIAGRYATVTERVVGDSVAVLRGLAAEVDVFLHDSLHTFEHETAELAAVAPSLAPDALVLSDNAHATDALLRWTEATGRRFAYFREEPADHWYPGAGIGAARR